MRLQHWFKLWVVENYSVRQLCQISGYSASKITRIKNHWLDQIPEDQIDYSQVHYLIYDATYFHKDGCLLNLMNAINQRVISHIYVKKESYLDAYPWFSSLKRQGLDPECITTDGEQSTIRALKQVWPNAKLQRCLYHIQHEGMRWLRTYPKTEAGRQLRKILSTLCNIKTVKERRLFIRDYRLWLTQYHDFIRTLPKNIIAFKDLQRTIVLINNALPDMFYYLDDNKVFSTTNALEGFHSRLKTDYQRHRGLSKQHRINYIYWYCYLKNNNK
jgi:transposase-like protein